MMMVKKVPSSSGRHHSSYVADIASVLSFGHDDDTLQVPMLVEIEQRRAKKSETVVDLNLPLIQISPSIRHRDATFQFVDDDHHFLMMTRKFQDWIMTRKFQDWIMTRKDHHGTLPSPTRDGPSTVAGFVSKRNSKGFVDEVATAAAAADGEMQSQDILGLSETVVPSQPCGL